MPIRMAVFDMAGTTISDDHAVFNSFQKAFEVHGFEVTEEMINPLMGYKKPVAVKKILEQLQVEPNRTLIEEIHDYFVDDIINYYESSPDFRAIDGSEDAMRQLKSKGVRIALNTGFSLDIARAILQRLKWIDQQLVDDYIASDEVENGRPDPAMILELMRRANIADPKEVIKIGDTESDINEGRNAGCSLVVAVTTGAFTRKELEQYSPDHIIDSLSALNSLLAHQL